jgi:hypothetical protein
LADAWVFENDMNSVGAAHEGGSCCREVCIDRSTTEACIVAAAVFVQDEQRILTCWKAALQAGGRRLKLAVLDHVVSFPPVVMPVQQICSLCRCAETHAVRSRQIRIPLHHGL